MAEHTPFPLTADFQGDGKLFLRAANYYAVAEIYAPLDSFGQPDLAAQGERADMLMHRANTQPDLLAALEGLADYWEAAIKGTPDVANDYASDGFAFMQQARTAIAKARGK